MMTWALTAAQNPRCGRGPASPAGRRPRAGHRPAGSRLSVGSRPHWVLAVTLTAVACVLAGCAPGVTGGRRTDGGGRATLRGRTTLGSGPALGAGAALAGGKGARGRPVPGRGKPVWLLSRSALAQVAGDPTIRAVLERSRVYEILRPGQRPLARFGAIPVVIFPAISALAAAVATRRIPAQARSLLYDPEAWSFTPAAEQRAPVQAATRAAALARAHNLGLIVAPALDLTSVLAPHGRAPRWRQFLDLRLAASFAKTSSVVGLQAQSLERDTAAYAGFVGAAARQARAANPRVTVVAGLSTNPPGAPVSSKQLLAAIRATRYTVEGYWLNIPGRGPRCPGCRHARPGVGRRALRTLL
jgi:hypothetical protein